MEAIGLIELRSVARGIRVCDAMMKKAPVKLMEARTVCPGKYMVLVRGDVASVEEAVREGISIGAELVVDELFLPQVHGQVIPAMEACTEVAGLAALGIVETFSVASAIVSADTAVKAAKVDLIELRLANGLGGKSFYTLTGDISEVEAAIEAGIRNLMEGGTLVAKEIIPAPHADLNFKLL
ncbi:MAG: BMC domain-containing protein [Nitrospinae bacterium]|nr:BMC domain-containing protein [Nitrospinota bacterium]